MARDRGVFSDVILHAIVAGMDETLFPLGDRVEPEPGASKKAPPRLITPNRDQIELRPVDIDSLVPADHPVRIVWAFVDAQDLSPLTDAIRAVEGGPGHSATDPRVLMALWLYATLDGVGSARALARLSQQHTSYQWICGGVPVNYHTQL